MTLSKQQQKRENIRPCFHWSSSSSRIACLFLIRAFGEFSAQNENSRENSHHRRTAKLSISRNYAWPDASIRAASTGFSFHIFSLPFQRGLSVFIVFTEDECVLFFLCLPLCLFIRWIKRKKKKKNRRAFVKLIIRFFPEGLTIRIFPTCLPWVSSFQRSHYCYGAVPTLMCYISSSCLIH